MLEIFMTELIGTCLLILLGNGVVSNVLLKKSKGYGGGWIVITAGWAFAVAIAVYGGFLSGAHFNPAVTLGFALVEKTAWNLLPIYWIAQFLGAFFGSFLVWVLYFNHFEQTADPTLKLLCFCTKPAIYHPFFNFVTEVIATAVLLFGILIILDPHNEVSKGLLPYLIGILIFAIGLSLGGPTGFAINPARDFGPRVMHALLPMSTKGPSEWHYAWIPFFAPLVGGSLGAKLYNLSFGFAFL